MQATSLYPAAIVLLIAMLTGALLGRGSDLHSGPSRYATIDGLRGYLALLVFTHHSVISYFTLRSGQWVAPPSTYYIMFGQGAVSLFFMITGFLFFNKLIDGRTRPIDWPKFFMSRVLRLVPLYLFAMALMGLVVAIESHASLREPPGKVINDALTWLCFTLGGNPDVNGVPNTFTIIAGVTWSLPYEWFFYFSLPLLAIFVGVRPTLGAAVAGLVGIVLIRYEWVGYRSIILHGFLGGIAAAFLARWPLFTRLASTRSASALCLVLLIVVDACFDTAYANLPTVLLSLAFCLIAAGTSLFGLLNLKLSRALGEIAYSLYLLHGILLYVTFHLILGVARSAAMTPTQHWLVVMAIAPVLVGGCFFSYRWIERPAMNRATPALRWLRSARA